MKLFSILRKPTFAIFLAGLTVFASCSQYETDEIEQENLSLDQLKNIHLDIKNRYQSESSLIQKTSSDDELSEIFNSKFEENLEVAQNQGVEYLFESNGLESSLPSTIDWALNNIDNENFYEELLQREEIQSVEQAELIFSYLQTFIEYNNFSANAKSAYSKGFRGSGCGRAVVGTILTTAIFAGVTVATGGFGTAAAVGFLLAKGWNTYNVIAACSEE